MKTKICLTVDTEFSIDGALARPAERRPVGDEAVWCRIDGQSHGLGFLADSLARVGAEATFFIEVMQIHYFKDDPMQDIAAYLAERGHDLQLHIHPCWSIFKFDDWQERARVGTRLDDFVDRPLANTVALIQEGVETFARWGLPKPIIMRTGSTRYDRNTFHALAQAGIPYSSTIGVGYFRGKDEDLRLYSGAHDVHGVRELPILSYVELAVGPYKRLKTLTITGTSTAQMQGILWQAHALQMPAVVILTHPFEFVEGVTLGVAGKRPHRLNQLRLNQLLDFVTCHADCFEFETLHAAAQTFPSEYVGRNDLLCTANSLAWNRIIETKFKLHNTAPVCLPFFTGLAESDWLESASHLLF